MHVFTRSLVLMLAVSLVFSLSAAAWAREAVITMKDGRTLKGEVAEEDSLSITLVISSIKNKLMRDQIKSVEFLKTADEEYADRRAKIKDTDLTERYKLAGWAYQKKAYALAKKELDDLVVRDPGNPDYKFMRDVVVAKLKEEGKPVTPDPAIPATPATPVTPVKPVEGHVTLPTKKLEQKAINKLRVFEVDMGVKPEPRVVIPRDAIDKFAKEFANDADFLQAAKDANKFRAMKGLDQLKVLFAVRARGYYEEVQVRDDPPAIREFRNNVHKNYVLTYCATAECHGGAKAGGLFLFNNPPTSDDTVHTNLFILSSYENDKAFMVDREYPGKSLLVQYGMARDKATSPHPEVAGWQPKILLGDKDRTHVMLTQWIELLLRPRPDYELGYAIPKLPSNLKKPADAPVKPPATGATTTTPKAPAPPASPAPPAKTP